MDSELGQILRELGGMAQHLENIDGKLDEVVVQTKITNGRVNDHDVQIAVLQARESRIEGLEERIERVEKRPDVVSEKVRSWILLGAVPVAVALLTVVLHG